MPGVSAAEGCAAYAGIPLTLRGVAQAVLLTTGHTRDDGTPTIGEFQPGQTLALYMGVAQYAEIADALIAKGYARETPVAVVESGTTDRQRVVRTALGNLAAAQVALEIQPPALLIVGETTRYAERYSWFAPSKVEHFADEPADEQRSCKLPTEHQQGGTMIYESILDTIGNTPVVKLHRIPPKHVTIYVKIEAFNPLSSVKDRLAFAIIDDAERRGTLKPGQTVVEATSGNTGIALAMVCAARGYPFVATMVETFSVERRKIMRALGAKVILTPAAERGTGMVRLAAALAEKHGWFLARQFQNPANPAYHRQTTGPEILKDFAGRRLDFWVTGWGTGGTLTGAGEVIKLARPEVQIIATEPAGASLLGGKTWAPHKIQGWTPDFLPDVLNPKVFDQLVPVTDEEGKNMARRLAREEGIFVGISSGATLAAALKAAETREAGLGAARDAARHGRALSRHVPLRRLERGLRRRVARELGQEVTRLADAAGTGGGAAPAER